ncbi:MAG: SusC/RagA family TonB-linked outer membrane protein [Longimicrobiales bacterium]
MQSDARTSSHLLMSALMALLVAAPALHAQQTGIIAGRVTDAQTGQPIPAAQVFVADLNIGVLSQQNGSYLLQNIPVGPRTVTVQRIGYTQATQNVTVAGGQTAVLDFRIEEQALALDEIVVTGTAGGSTRRALGNSVEVASVAQLTDQAPLTNLQSVLAGRTPGMRFGRTDGQVGGGSPITIRGVTSTQLGSQPLIFVDGVRVNNDATVGPRSGGQAGGNASALNDINPDDIESIEIIKGPSAATLYGTEASAGVIQIITKRGAAGAPEFEFEVGQGTNFMRDPQGRLGTQYACSVTLPASAFNACPAASIVPVNFYDETNDYYRGQGRYANLPVSNPLFAEAATYKPLARNEDMFQNGQTQRYNLTVRGGSEAVRYYVGATWNDEVGIVDYNTNNQAAMRANLSFLLAENLNVDVSTAYSQGKTRFATVSGEGGAWHQLTWGFMDQIPGIREDNPATATVDESLGRGFLGFQERFPDVYENTDIWRKYSKFTGSLTVNHRFLEIFSHRMTFGLDRDASINNEFLPGGSDIPAAPNGLLDYARPLNTNVTFDYGLSARYAVTENISTVTSAGAQYYAKYNDNVQSRGVDFLTRTLSVIDQTAQGTRTIDYTYEENKTLGFYVQEEVSWQDRIFLTGAVRGDDNSAFGSNFELQYYPKLSASWVISEESFWPAADVVNSFRLRGAWGKSGRQPSTFAQSTLLEIIQGPNGNGFVPETVGNPDIGPEVSTEIEVGFDAAFFGDRLSGAFSYYQNKTEDMLVNQSLAPSTGLVGTRQANLGAMKSWGWEASLNARVYESDPVSFDVDLSADYTKNEITSLGAGILPTGNFQIGWPFPNVSSDHILRYGELNTDVNGDPIPGSLNVASLVCDGGLPARPGGAPILQGGVDVPCAGFSSLTQGLLLGPAYPNYTVNVAPTVTLFQDIQIFSVIQAQYGRWVASTDAQFACGTYRSCYSAVIRTDPLFLAGNNAGPVADDRYQGRYPADFWKVRQLGVRYSLPENLTAPIGADRASFSISANNMWVLWQKTKTDLGGQPIYDPDYSNNGNDPNATALWEMPGIASITAALRVTF